MYSWWSSIYLHGWRRSPELFYLAAEALHPLNNNPLSPLLPSLWHPPFHFLFLWIWLLSIPHVSRIIQYFSLCDWLVSLSTMSWGSSMLEHRTWFPSLLIFHCITYHTVFIRSSVDGHLGWLLWILLQYVWACNGLFSAHISLLNKMIFWLCRAILLIPINSGLVFCCHLPQESGKTSMWFGTYILHEQPKGKC